MSWGLLGRRKDVLEEAQEKWAMRMAAQLLLFQRRLADRLNHWTAEWSVALWKMLLLGFCLGFGGYFTYLIYRAVG